MKGMVDVRKKQCIGDGCTKYANHGLTGSRKPDYCAGHALEGMVNVWKKQCIGDGCTKYANHGLTGSRKPDYCAGHAL